MKLANKASLIVLLAAFVALTSSYSQAGEAHYRWKDQWGNPVHSDRPPPKGIDYEVVESGTSLVRRVNSAEGVVPADIEPVRENKFKKADTDKIKYVVKKNPEYCELAKSNLNSLNTRARIRVRNEQGEYHILTEEEKESQRLDAADQIEAYCD